MIFLAALIPACNSHGQAPSPRAQVVASAATSLDFNLDPPAGLTFGTRVSVLAEVFDGSCILDDETGESPTQGSTFATLSDLCGLANAVGTVQLVDEVQPDGSIKRVWTLQGHADAVDGSDAETNAYFADTFTPEPAGVGVSAAAVPTPAATAHLFLHAEVSGDIAGNFAEYETDSEIFSVQPDGSFLPFFNPPGADLFVRAPGHHEKSFDIDLPPVPVGTKLLLDTGFLFDFAAPHGGVASSDATATYSLCSHDDDVTIASVSGSTGNCPAKGDLAVVSVEPVQAVFGASSLVAGKDTVLKVVLDHTFTSPTEASIRFHIAEPGILPGDFEERVQLPFDASGHPCRKTFYFPSSVDAETPTCDTSAAGSSLLALGLAPQSGGRFQVHVEAQPLSGSDSNPANDFADSDSEVKTTVLRLAYVRVDPLLDNMYAPMSPSDFGGAAHLGNLETLGMFPVGDGFAGNPCANGTAGVCAHLGSPLRCRPVASGSNLSTCSGMILDLQNVRRMARAFDSFVNVPVGLVPQTYFTYQGFHTQPGDDPADQLGLTVQTISLARSDAILGDYDGFRIPTVPHELVHALTSSGHVPAGPPFPSGYWVGCQNAVGLAPAACEVPPNAANLMLEVAPDQEAPDVWISNDSYESLLALAVDPDAILDIDGTATREGVITIGDMTEYPRGSVSRASHSDLSVSAVDAQGAVLSQLAGLGIFANSDEEVGDGAPSKDFAVFGISLAYPPTTAMIVFKKGTKVVLEVEPLAETLRTAIEGTVDAAYAKNPAERRKALLQKVDAFEQVVRKGKIGAASNMLDNDIIPQVSAWLVDFEVREPGVEYDRAAVLRVANQVQARLKLRSAK